jgi:hypothetical protein
MITLAVGVFAISVVLLFFLYRSLSDLGGKARYTEQELVAARKQAEENKKFEAQAEAQDRALVEKEEELQRISARLLEVEGSEREAQRLKAQELQKLSTRLFEQDKATAGKEQEIQKISAELAALQERQKAALRGAEESVAKDSEIMQLKIQLQRVTDDLKKHEEDITRLNGAGLDVSGIEKSLEEEKREVHELRLRLEESKMKAKLLDDKTKEAAEAIARFAQGKEFDEFRKSI